MNKASKNETVLIVGASGTVGSELVRLLKADGYQTRAITSQKTKVGPGQVYANLATGESLSAAFEGVDRAYLLSPPGYADQYKILSPLIQEAKRRGLKKVVLMTAMGANANEASPLRRAEVELEKSGLTYNIIRPNWFMQNFNTFWVQGIREQHVIALPAGTARTSFIDARDISAVAARLLVDDSLSGNAFDLTGPAAVTHAEAAAAISSATGLSVRYQDIEPKVLKDGLLSAGLPADYVDFMILIFGFLKEGYSAGITSSVKDILGREPHSLAQYVQDYKKSWL